MNNKNTIALTNGNGKEYDFEYVFLKPLNGASLYYVEFDEDHIVPVVRYSSEDWFSPDDWQQYDWLGDLYIDQYDETDTRLLPYIECIEWAYRDTTKRAVVLDGLPRLLI